MNLDSIESRNIYRLFTDEGIRYIKILGYFYEADHDDWRHVEFCWFTMPLKQYLANEDKWDEWESECKQYISDLTGDEVMEYFRSCGAKPLDWSEVETAPDGVYI